MLPIEILEDLHQILNTYLLYIPMLYYIIIKMTSMFFRKLKVILPLILLYCLCYFKTFLCSLTDNIINDEIGTSIQELPLKEITSNYMFISTKDGKLHKYSTTNQKEKLWTISLGQALITSNVTTTKKVTNDVLLLPLDDKLYYYENEKFTPLNIFIKDIVERTPLSFHDYLLVGNKKSTVIIIDIDTGEIIQQSNEDYNLVSHILKQNSNKQSFLTVIRVDYMLTCIGKEEKFWDTTYSEIIIKIGNEQAPNGFLPRKDLLRALDYQSDFGLNEIMSVHRSENNNLPVKIYDKSSRRVYSNRNTHSSSSSSNINYNDFHLINDDIEFEEYLKWKKEKYSQQINDLIWILIVLIVSQIRAVLQIYFYNVSLEFTLFCIGIAIIFTRIIRTYYENKHKGRLEKEANKEGVVPIQEEYFENNCSEDDSINNKEEEIEEIREKEKKIVKRKTKTKRYVDANEENRLIIYNPFTTSLVIDNGNNNVNVNAFAEIYDELEIKQYEKERVNQVQVNSYSNSDNNTVIFEVNHTTKVIYQKNEETEKIHQKVQEEINQPIQSKSKSRRNSSPMKHFVIIDEENSKDSNSFRKKKFRKFTDKNYSTGEIEINEEDELEESIQEKVDDNMFPIKDKPKEENMEKMKTSTYPSTNTMQQYSSAGSRLEKDFKDYEKIGQGGFGVVLKAKHKIDEEIYAIKIINLKDLDEQNVVSEAKTMTKIHSKHIVEYKTCWFEHTLGNASKFVTTTAEDFSESYSMSSSMMMPSKNKKQKRQKQKHNNTILSKVNHSMINISKTIEEDNKEQYSNDSIIFEEIPDVNVNENTNELNKIFEDPYSDDEIHNTKKETVIFRDDSNIGSKRSSLNKRNSFIDNLYFFIQMEYCDGLPLDKFINQHQDKYIPKETIFTFMQQIIKSLDKIHNRGIIHRDIKPANIFVEGDKAIKIGDFGLATEKKRNITSSFLDEQANQSEMVGTPLYFSPEQLAGKNYNEKVDIYASGLVLYEMCACFGTLMERRECIQALKSNRVFNDRLNEQHPIESQIILWMTETNQKNRPSAIELLQSSLFNQWKESVK